MRGVKSLIIMGMVISLFLGESVLAKVWQPYQFSGKSEHFEYLITTFEDEKEERSTYILDIKKGEGNLYDVTVTSKWTTEELGDSILAGFWGARGIMWLFLNPMYGMYFTNFDLEVGEAVSFFGAGYMKITGKEKVAGVEGFVCEFREEKKAPLLSRWVINPDIALPLKTENFNEEGKLEHKVELQKYSR